MSEQETMSLSAHEIRREVCHELGITREEFQDIDEALERLVESLNRDAALTATGVLRTKALLQTCLKQRHDLIAARTLHHRSFRRKIVRPLFILGLPRSGTTLLHHLFNQDPDNRTPRLWELSNPLPPPEPSSYTNNPRIEQTQHNLQLMNSFEPAMRRAHLLDAQEPDECVAIFNRCLLSVQFLTQYAVPGYAEWFWRQPLTSAYAWYRDELLLLQTNVTGDWVLKSPFHQWGIEALRAEFPDSLLVQTHRQPLEILASGASFCETLRTALSDRVDPLACGRDWSNMVGRYVSHFSAWRDQANAADQQSVVDISYRKLIADPLGTVGTIYRAWGKKLGLEARVRMQAWLKAHPQHAHGEHRYDAARYGIDAATVQREMAGYSARYQAFL